MSNLNDLTVIIVTYKTKDEILFNCINSIKKDIKIINVENSNDQSHKVKIEKKFNNVKVILTGQNLGYGAANNLGLKNNTSRYVLISNPDVEYKKNFFDDINFYLKEDYEFSIIGPTYDDESTHLSYGSLDGSIIDKNFNEFFLKEVGYVVGCSMLLDTKNIKTEKLIPKLIYNIIKNKNLPIYGKGTNSREWIYVTDHCEALIKIFTKGKIGNFYNIGSNINKTNLEITKGLIKIAKKNIKIGKNVKINFVKDRPGHDKRYALNSKKILSEIKWKPKINLIKGLNLTFKWYLNNLKYYNSLKMKKATKRIGLNK